jgi:hypothetical protein
MNAMLESAAARPPYNRKSKGTEKRKPTTQMMVAVSSAETGRLLEFVFTNDLFALLHNVCNHPAAASDSVKRERRTTAARCALHCYAFVPAPTQS